MFRNDANHAHTRPLWLPRLLSLLLLFAFGIAGMGVGINALVKFHDQKKQLASVAPAGASVDINSDDVLDSGYVITVVCGLLALVSLFFLSPLIFVATKFAPWFLRLEALILGFLSTWLFATLIPFDDFFANRAAKVSVSIGGIAVPDGYVQQIIAGLGATPVYKHVDYLRLPAIIPWFTFLFGVTSAVLAWLGSRRSKAANAYPLSSSGVDKEVVSEKDKSRIAQQDV